MKVTANTSFAGAELSMFQGETRDVPEGVAAPLLKCGYLKTVESEKPKRAAKDKTED